MQPNNNHGIDTLVHIADPFFNYLAFFLHMYLSCYFTLLLYFAIRPGVEGTACVFSFFLDWHLIAILSLPVMKNSKKFLRQPASLMLIILSFLSFMFLIVFIKQDSLKETFVSGIQNYQPILFRIFSG